jgi:alpha-galactosidase
MRVVGLGWDEFAASHPTLGLPAGRPDLTEAEQRAHFSLWAMLAAPLLAGNDVRTQDSATRDILTNAEVIAVDQDSLVAQGRPLAADPRIIVKRLADESVAVALLNTGDDPTGLATDARAVGLPEAGCYVVRDLWAHTEAPSSGVIGGQSVPPHGVAMFRVRPYCG